MRSCVYIGTWKHVCLNARSEMTRSASTTSCLNIKVDDTVHTRGRFAPEKSATQIPVLTNLGTRLPHLRTTTLLELFETQSHAYTLDINYFRNVIPWVRCILDAFHCTVRPLFYVYRTREVWDWEAASLLMFRTSRNVVVHDGSSWQKRKVCTHSLWKFSITNEILQWRSAC